MQLKREAKSLTVIGLNTEHANCCIIYIISNMFVTHDNCSELIRKISPNYIILSIYKLRHHKILVPVGPFAKEDGW